MSYRVTFLQRIDLVGTKAVERIHAAVYSDTTIESIAKHFKSIGMMAVKKVEIIGVDKDAKSKLNVEQVIELFYPEVQTNHTGAKVFISDDEKIIKKEVLENSIGKKVKEPEEKSEVKEEPKKKTYAQMNAAERKEYRENKK